MYYNLAEIQNWKTDVEKEEEVEDRANTNRSVHAYIVRTLMSILIYRWRQFVINFDTFRFHTYENWPFELAI